MNSFLVWLEFSLYTRIFTLWEKLLSWKEKGSLLEVFFVGGILSILFFTYSKFWNVVSGAEEPVIGYHGYLITSHNALMLMAFAICGIGSMWMAIRLTKSKWKYVVGCVLAFGFSLFMTQHEYLYRMVPILIILLCVGVHFMEKKRLSLTRRDRNETRDCLEVSEWTREQ